MIYQFQPFSTTKQLGETYNAHCNLVPNDDDWIMILDYDANVVNPIAYTIIERAIENNPGTHVFGVMTNRIGIASQRVGKEPDPRLDMGIHYKIADQLATEFPNGECKPARIVGGFCLIFQKWYWKKNQFQAKVIDNGVTFDLTFIQAARQANALKIIKGAYLWHGYRLWKRNWADKSHLY